MKRLTALLLTIVTLVSLCLSTASALPIDQMEGVKPYGQLVEVNGKKMNVAVLGEENKPTLLLIPGQSEISSYYGFSNLMKILQKKYRVVMIDYFGFGLSDVTDAPRTSENFADEIHTVVQKLGIRRYVLLAHSMGGIYSLTHAVKYPDEVQGFIGIDTSTPGMEGGLEVHSETLTEASIPDLPDVDEEAAEQYRLIARYTMNNPNMVDEDAHASVNLKDAETKRFPAGMRGLYLLATQSDEDMELRRESFEAWYQEMYKDFKDNKGVTEEDLKQLPRIARSWTGQHIDLHEDPADAQTEMIEGSHVMYQTQYRRIAERRDAFMQSLGE